MPLALASTTIKIYDKTPDGLALTGTIDNSSTAIPTTTLTFAAGCRLTDLSTGDVYTNMGTSTTPVWQAGLRTVSVALAAADLIAMYTTPVVVVPAVLNKAIIVDSVEFDMTRSASAFTGGGVVAVQYDSTANGAGTATHATIAATVVTGAAGRTITARIPVVQSDIASASIVGKGLYISNATAAFAAGTGTASVIVRYHLV